MIKKWMLPVVALLPLLTSCEKDTDSNPTFQFQEGQTFALAAAVNDANYIVDLKAGQPVRLYCDQPNYGGIPVATTYYIQMSLDQNFMTTTENVEYCELKNSASETVIDVNANELNDSIIALYARENGVKEENFPSNTPMAAYFRLRAEVRQGVGECFSNTVKVNNIIAQYTPPELTAPDEKMVFVGSFFGDSWSKWYEMTPMVGHVSASVSEFKYVVYNPGNAVFKFGRAKDEYIGFDKVKEVTGESKSQVSGVDDGYGGKNIQVGAEGWYVLNLIVKVAGTEYEYTLDLNPAEVYTIGESTTGDWSGTKMTPNADGIFVSEAFIGSGELRAYVKVPGVDWWQSEFTFNTKDNTLVWRTPKQNINDTWADLDEKYVVNCTAGQRLYVDFKNGTAEVK